ncbi:MAG: M15 family metallopeptidase [Spirochaetes bacterium]|nr:M15 family metallopeptidase [Spirochaetota bacterium]
MRFSLFFPSALVCISAVCSTPLFGQDGGELYFALPKGYGYTRSSFLARNDYEVPLRFGERLKPLSSFLRGDVVWYSLSRGTRSFFLPEPFIVRFEGGGLTEVVGNIPIGRETVDRSHPLPLFYRPDDLVPLAEEYKASGYEWRALLLREEANEAFVRMMDDAKKQGICIRVISAFRDAPYQSNLYQRAIDRYGPVQKAVAKPGHSEHQLGTTCDLTTDEIGYGLSSSFEKTVAFEWLRKNVHRYGISYSYPLYKQRITGYIYEPWHFRYWGNERWTLQSERMGLFFSR